MSWNYHTHVNPQNIENYQNIAFNEAFQEYLSELLECSDTVCSKLGNSGSKHRITVTFDRESNIIRHTHMKLYTFYKDRFLTNKLFRSKLTEHFKALGIVVKGPYMKKQNVWIIDFFHP